MDDVNDMSESKGIVEQTLASSMRSSYATFALQCEAHIRRRGMLTLASLAAPAQQAALELLPSRGQVDESHHQERTNRCMCAIGLSAMTRLS